MDISFFRKTFRNAQVPVIVLEDRERYPVVFANARIRLLLNPLLTIDKLKESSGETYLEDMIRFLREEQREGLFRTLAATGTASAYKAELLNYEDVVINVSISANTVEMDGGRCLVLYIEKEGGGPAETDINSAVSTAFQIANHTSGVEAAIDDVLAFAGSYVRVSRAYIFEEISEEYTRNTYEWCAKGVEPAIQDLQNLRKEDYNYDVIVGGDMYITDDIRDLPENDRVILETQGIKSLAILPLIHMDKPLGYVGFDDCEQYRKWSGLEINLLKSIAGILVSLMVRRDSENRLNRSKEILQLISDNAGSVIYVTDIHTHEVIFLNKPLTGSLGVQYEDIVGRQCYSVLQEGMEGPCPFCPIPKMLAKGNMTETWEFQNTRNKNWYLIKDSIIKWIDGREVNIETAVEITKQKAYEEQLEYYASIDTMTGAYKREWGYKIMREMLGTIRLEQEEISLVFLDLDGLKAVNDAYGHDAGDEMITKAVEIIRKSIRKSDVVCRWGGDEFILLLRCDTERAEAIIKMILRKLEQYNRTSGKPYSLSFSYGVAKLEGDDEDSMDAVIAKADQRMYGHKTGKQQGDFICE